MKVTVVGTGYVGLVTGVCLADIGHHVTCVDIDEAKVAKLSNSISPIYEPGIEDLMVKNKKAGSLSFTSKIGEALKESKLAFIAVGTPPKPDGTADLSYIKAVAEDIGKNIQNDFIVVTKSTVPVGTNHMVKEIVKQHNSKGYKVDICSNPEFLREGSAIEDTFNGDRIIVGTENEEVNEVMRELYSPLNIPIFYTDVLSSEMIKYASNAFLATKISFINEISNICENVGANVLDVAKGMGMDDRIGMKFLNAGIGYGGSCFPKDTKALVQIAGTHEHDFRLLKSVIEVNNNQQQLLVKKAKKRFGTLAGKKVALLGLAFKPNTDDMREAASIVVAEQLIREGATVIGYDPIAMEAAKSFLPKEVIYSESLEDAIQEADILFIITEWKEIKEMNLTQLAVDKQEPIIFDGRNCFTLQEAKNAGIEYYSIGRTAIVNDI